MKRLLLLPLAFLASCSNENTLYEENKALSPELEWKQEDVRTFSFTNTDTESVVNETVLFRYANGYQFDKMIVEVIKEAPSGEKEIDTLEMQIRQANGDYIGEAGYDIWDSSHPYKSDVVNGENGSYTYTFRHLMPVDPVQMTMEIGLKIDKANI